MTWQDKYKLAKAYYEHYGNLEIPQNYKTFNGYEEDKEGFNLGCWINAQRNAFKGIGTSKITKKQIKQLDEIKMVWNVYDTNWNEMYKLAKIYYEHYGNLEISFDYKTINGYERDKEGFNLGCWIHTQRQAFKGTGTSKITKKQIKQLDEIKMVWNVYDTNWNEMYKLAKAYYKYYGNLEIPFDYKTINGYESDKEGFNLGYWINTQRRTYKGDSTRKIAEEQIRLLDEIGMIWYFRDEKLQKEIITSSNLKKKNIEILNRTRTLLNQFASDTLPTKEELNESFIKKLELK